jgi:hypothetical protein
MYLVVFMVIENTYVHVVQRHHAKHEHHYIHMYRCYSTITLTINTTKYICTGGGVHGEHDSAVLPVHMYLVVFMVSVIALYHLYICI